MESQIFLSDLTDPTPLFVLPGALAVATGRDLAIPASADRLLSLYPPFAIGSKERRQLARRSLSAQIGTAFLAGITIGPPAFLKCKGALQKARGGFSR